MNDHKNTILNILKEHQNKLIPGSKIASLCNVTRSYVNKVIKELRLKGYEITCCNRFGYIYQNDLKVLNEEFLSKNLNMKVIVLDEVDSTNNYLKKISKDLNEKIVLVVANTQTAGRGRLGRNFVSNSASGIYMSLLVKPCFDLEYAKKITCLVASAVALSIDELTGLNSQIKWVNDIYLNHKKVCGILTEASTQVEESYLDYLIMGIGINMYKQTFTNEIKNLVTTIEDETGQIYNRNELIIKVIEHIKTFLDHIENDQYMDTYLTKSFVIGKEVTLNLQGNLKQASIINITRDGELIALIDGETKKLASAEITRMVI